MHDGQAAQAFSPSERDGSIVGRSPPWFGTHVFGGILLAQSLYAARSTTPEGLRARSLHAYFLGAAPNVQDDINGLHTAASDASSLNAQVLAATPQPELKVFYAQLQAAITALATDAQYNGTTLSEAVTVPENGGTGNVEEKKASTLRAETGLPSVRLMNAEALKLLRQLHLEISQYDVPGGNDANPSDHSDAQ